MSYTLAAAAAACGMNKSTILRAIKSGKVSATKDEHGEWHIEPMAPGRGSRPERDVARRSAFRAIDLGTIDGEAANLPSCRPMKKRLFVMCITSRAQRIGEGCSPSLLLDGRRFQCANSISSLSPP
jgi:hypothetical protein